jgi:hypothetical protein
MIAYLRRKRAPDSHSKKIEVLDDPPKTLYIADPQEPFCVTGSSVPPSVVMPRATRFHLIYVSPGRVFCYYNEEE